MNYVDVTYINMSSVYLRNFKQISNTKYNCSCPFCGDSKKNKHKARGYIYESSDTYIYKCHNCGTSTNLYGLLKHIDHTMYIDYCKEKNTSKFIKPKKEKLYEKSVLPKNEDVLHIGNRILKKLIKVCDNKDALAYLNDRCIPNVHFDNLYYIDNIAKLANTIPKYKESSKKIPRTHGIVIPFIKDGIVTHLQCRYLDKKSYIRYMTFQTEDDVTNKVWGYDLINKSEKVYVFEGAFDAMFLNGIAIANASLHTAKTKFNSLDMTLVYDVDFAVNKDVFKSMERAVSIGANVVIYDDCVANSGYKDINDLIKHNVIKHSELKTYIDTNTYNGFEANMRLQKIKFRNRL